MDKIKEMMVSQLMPENKSTFKKKTLLNTVGILGHVPDDIQEQLKGKTFQQIREEGVTKYLQKNHLEVKTSHEELSTAKKNN
ncbi:hypothetical protein [Paenibacillus sp. FSL R7-0272]|uniref:hypothetical protein n=1 Tax=Paenibacillus sp. FSL R7-0272 TaxID=2921679 RepID=UPI0030EC2A56